MSLRGAIKLASLAVDMDAPVDVFLSHKCGNGTVKCVAPWPQIVCNTGDTPKKGEHNGEAAERKKDGQVLQYSTKVNADKIREGKAMDEWQRNW